MKNKERLGDQPIEPKYRQQMNALADALDKILNGEVERGDRGAVTSIGGQPHGTVVLTLDARPENLALTRLALTGVAANAGAPRDVVADLKLAVTEACTNVIRHAYGADGGVGSIVVRYRGEPGMLSIEVEDSGSGFEPGALAEASEENGGGSGMGLMIIRVLTDELEISATGSGTRLRLVKRFSPES